MKKQIANRIIMILCVLAVSLMAGCGKEDLSMGKEAGTGMKVEDILAKELPIEEGRQQQETETEQSISQDLSEDRGTQSALGEAEDEIVQDVVQEEGPKEEEKDMKSARMQKYQTVLMDILEKQVYPDGTDCVFDESNAGSGNQFAVFDVDQDGEKELILCITSASTAGMREIIYDYDEETDSVREEYSGFPGGVFYENGLIEESLSHNQGMAPLGDFWPYMLHRYQAESDSYQCTFIVDAWEKGFREQDYDGNPYPEEIDEEKSGIVYYLMEGGAYDMASTVPVSSKVYEEWQKEQGLGSAGMEIPFQAFTKDNIGNI